MADLLRGDPPACTGLICMLTGISSGPLVNRSLVLLGLSLSVAAPLLLLRCGALRAVRGGPQAHSQLHVPLALRCRLLQACGVGQKGATP